MRVLLLSSLSLALLSCTDADEPGLVLAMSTDMIVPQDIDSVGVYMQHLEADGRVRRQWTFAAAPIFDGTDYRVRFPATLAVASRKVDGDRLRTRVVAFGRGSDGPVPLVMREARTSMPNDRTAVLRLPLLWINAGTVTDNAPGSGIGDDTSDPFSRFDSDCPPEQTRGDSGECESIDVPLESLPDHAQTSENACFDVTQVFGPGADLVRREATAGAGCTLPLGRAVDTTHAQVALVASSGYAVGSEYVRPLPRGAFDIRDESLILKPRVCAELGTASAVLVSERATDAAVETVCSPWTQAPSPVTVTPAAPIPQVPDAGIPDANVPDVSVPDAGLPDASTVTDWTFEAGVSSVVVGARGVYAATESALYKYPLVPGGAVTSAPHTAGALHLAGVDAAGKDLLFAARDNTLVRIDPDTLVAVPVEICLDTNCRTLGSPELTSLAQARVLRGGDNRLYYLVSEPVFESAPKILVLSTALDGSDGRTSAAGLFDLMNSPPTTPGAIYPSSTGIVVVTVRSDFFSPQRCTATGCSSGSFSTTPGYYRAVSLSSFSKLSGTTSYGVGGWETYDGMSYGSYQGLVRIENTTITSIVEDVGTTGALVRSGDRVCWHDQGALSCVDANTPTTRHAIADVQVGAELHADDTYIYWTDTSRTRMQRRLWSTLF